MSKITEKLNKLAQESLGPHEQILSGLRVNLKGTVIGTAIAATGGVLGAVMSGNVTKEGQEQAKSLAIPFKQSMALGITNSQMIFWGRSAFTGRPKNILGSIPLKTIAKVDFEKGGFGDKLKLTFQDDKILELESIKVDKGETFANKLKELLSNT